MSSRCRSVIGVGFVAVTLIAAAAIAAAQARELRVCADPDNLPFSNRQTQGFENRIAEVLARELDANLRYTWQRTGRGFIRTYLNKGECDVLIGAPVGSSQVLTTTPYYRSTFVFVTRADRPLPIQTLDDPRLRRLRIAVQFGDEGYTPAGFALGRRGLGGNLAPFSAVGPQARTIIDAVVDGRVDVAVVWGPLAGYLASAHNVRLRLVAVEPQVDGPGVAMAFDIAVAVRRDDTDLRGQIEGALAARRSDIARILATYGVVDASRDGAPSGGAR